MRRSVSYFVLSFAPLWGACAGEQPAELTPSSAAGAGQVAHVAGAGGVTGVAGGAGGALAGAVSATTGGALASSGAPTTQGGTTTAGASGSGGTNASGGAGGASNAAGAAGTATSMGGGPVIPPGCKVSSPVSFKADIGPWLNTSCGKGKGGGCHVTDEASTVNSACPDGTKKCGFNHAYDWITAGSHNEFCKQTPGPIRFTVVMDVVRRANPSSCTSTRVMPPDGPPLDACQMAALEAWLSEPKVLQLHRADDTSPSEPYLMPPFN
jgi:hypothetical protein